MKVKLFFEPEPEQMEFRGDRVLWDKLSKMDIKGDILEGVKKEIEKIIGCSLSRGEERIYIDKLSTGEGMSDGFVSKNWWNKKGLPLLRERIKATSNGK